MIFFFHLKTSPAHGKPTQILSTCPKPLLPVHPKTTPANRFCIQMPVSDIGYFQVILFGLYEIYICIGALINCIKYPPGLVKDIPACQQVIHIYSVNAQVCVSNNLINHM